MVPTYRERLRVEGAALAAIGTAGSAVLLATTEEARRWPLNTIGQLVVTGVLLGRFGPRTTRKRLATAVPLQPGEEGTGEPTPLWMLPLIMAGLVAAVVVPSELDLPLSGRAGWDAGLRVTAGCVLVGVTQAVVLERIVAEEERRTGSIFLRIRGSSLLRGTKLGALSQTRDT